MIESSRRTAGFLRARSRVLVFLAYTGLVVVFFAPVVFGGKSFLTSSFAPGVLPWGPYGSDVLAVRHELEGHTPVIDPASSAWTSEPWARVIGQMYRNGEIPLWNPFMGLGMPFAANMQSGVFFPLRLVIFLWPSPTTWNVYLLLRLVLIGFFMFEFLRLWRVSGLNAFAGGAALMFSGCFVLFINMWHLDVELLLPVLMVAAEKLLRSRTPRAAVVLGVLLSVSVLGGSPESLFFVWLFVAIYYAFRTLTIAARSRWPRTAVWVYARPFSLSVALGLVIASPLLVLGAEYLWHGYAPAHHAGARAGLGHYPSSGAVSLWIPYFFDHLGLDTRLPAGFSRWTVAPYLGVVPLTLAVLAPRRRPAMFFGVYAAMSLLKAYGIPPINLIGTLPGFDRVVFRYNQPVAAFCITVLMAFALDALSNQIVGRWSRTRVLGTAGAFGVATAAFVVYHLGWIEQTGWATVAPEVGIALTILGGLTVFLWVASRRPDFARSMNVGVVALLMLELFQRVPTFLPSSVDPFQVAPFVDMLRQDPTVFRLYGLDGVLHPNASGVYGLSDVRAVEALYPTRYLPLIQRTLDPFPRQHFTGGSRYDLMRSETVLDLLNIKYVVSLSPIETLTEAASRWEGPVSLTRYSIGGSTKTVLSQPPASEAMYRLRVPDRGGVLRFSLAADPAGWQSGRSAGVRYRVRVRTQTGAVATLFERYIDANNSAADRRWQDGAVDLSAYRGQTVGLLLVAEATRDDASGLGGWGELRLESPNWRKVYDAEVKVYRNERALPRAYVVHQAAIVGSADEALGAVISPDFDPRRLAILEEPLPQGSLRLPAPGSSEAVTITRYGAHQITLTAHLLAPGLLVLADTFYPQWEATVDGKRTKIYRANFLLRAVVVGAGTHELQFSYRPTHFYVASVVSVLTLVGALILGWVPRRS